VYLYSRKFAPLPQHLPGREAIDITYWTKYENPRGIKYGGNVEEDES
jgi:hypothetical protein